MLGHDLSCIIAFIVVFGNCTSSVNIKPISPFSDLNEVADFASIVEPENVIDFESEIDDSATMKDAGGVTSNPSRNSGGAPREPKKLFGVGPIKRPSEIFIESLVNEDKLADEEQAPSKESAKVLNQKMGMRANQLNDIKKELDEMGRLFAEKTMGHHYLSNSNNHARNLPLAIEVSRGHDNQEEPETESTGDPFEKELSTLEVIVKDYLDNNNQIQSDKETNSGNGKCCERGKTEEIRSNEQGHGECDEPKETKTKFLVMHFFKIDPKKDQSQGCASNGDEQTDKASANDVPNDSCGPKCDDSAYSQSNSDSGCGADSDYSSGSDSGPAPIDFPQGENTTFGDNDESYKNNDNGCNENSGGDSCDSADSANNENGAENTESSCDSAPNIPPLLPPTPLPLPQTSSENSDDDSDDDGKQVITINLYVDSKCSKHPREAPADYDYVAFLSQNDGINFLPAQKLLVDSGGGRKRRYNLFSESKYQCQSDKPDELKLVPGEKLQFKSLSSPILFINAVPQMVERQKRSMDPKENSYLQQANVLINTLNVSSLTSNGALGDTGPTLGSGTLVNSKTSDAPVSKSDIDEANILLQEFGDGMFTGSSTDNIVESTHTGENAGTIKSKDFDSSIVENLSFENKLVDHIDSSELGHSKDFQSNTALQRDPIRLPNLRHHYFKHLANTAAKPVGILNPNEANNQFQKNFINLFPNDDTNDHVSFYCDQPDSTAPSSNTVPAATTAPSLAGVPPLAGNSSSILEAANAASGIANFNQNESAPSIGDISGQANAEVANLMQTETECSSTTECIPTSDNAVYDKLGVYVVHGNAKKHHHSASGGDEEANSDEESGSNENGELFSEEDYGNDSDPPNVLDLVSNATTLSPGAVSASSGAVSLSEASLATLASEKTSSGSPTTGTALEGTTAKGSSAQPAKSLKSSVMSKLQNLQKDLKLVFEVQNILNGAKKKNPSDSRRKRDTRTMKRKRKPSVKRKRCKHKSAHHLGGSSALQSEVRQLGKILKFKQQEGCDSPKSRTDCDDEEKCDRSKRFLFKKKKKKKKKKNSFWRRVFGSTSPPSHFLGNPQNSH